MTPFADVIRALACFRRWLSQSMGEYVLAGTVVDIQRVLDQHKQAVSFDLEGANMLRQYVAMVGLFAKLGVRQMLLAYTATTAVPVAVMARTWASCVTSRTRSLVRSQARSLLSIAKSKSARSMIFAASSSLIRMPQMSRKCSGDF